MTVKLLLGTACLSLLAVSLPGGNSQALGSKPANTALASVPEISIVNQKVDFTATVSDSSGELTPTGSVDFMNGTSKLGTAPLLPALGDGQSQATFATRSLPVGIHTQLYAIYSGDKNFASSNSSVFTQIVVERPEPCSANKSVWGILKSPSPVSPDLGCPKTLTVCVASADKLELSIGGKSGDEQWFVHLPPSPPSSDESAPAPSLSLAGQCYSLPPVRFVRLTGENPLGWYQVSY